MYVIHCFSLFSFVGDGQPCPYGQTGTSLSTCSGEYFNDRVTRKHPLIFFIKSFSGGRYFTYVKPGLTRYWNLAAIHTQGGGCSIVQTRVEVDENCRN